MRFYKAKHNGLHISVCTPNYLHSIVAVAALKNGKHVLCEKPDAINVKEAIKMKEAADESKKVLMVMRNNRHTESSRFLKKKAADGDFGELYCGRCGWIRRRGIPGKGGWFTTKEQSGGGPLIDLGVHIIDLALYIMGNPKPVAVSGTIYNHFSSGTDIKDSEHSKFGEVVADGIFDVEDHAIGFIRFDNGAALQIEFSWASNIEEEKAFIEMRGSKAGFVWGKDGDKIFGEERGMLTNLIMKPAPVINWTEGHCNNIKHFFRVINGREKPDFTIEQGIDIIKILQAVYESAKLKKEILL